MSSSSSGIVTIRRSVDAEVPQLPRQERRVGVGHLAREDLVADDDDAGGRARAMPPPQTEIASLRKSLLPIFTFTAPACPPERALERRPEIVRLLDVLAVAAERLDDLVVAREVERGTRPRGPRRRSDLAAADLRPGGVVADHADDVDLLADAWPRTRSR